MKISIDAFECTEAGLDALSQTNGDLSVDEKKIIDLIFSASYANAEQLEHFEATFEQLSETVNLTRLVALKLLKFHNGRAPSRLPKNSPLIEALFERRDMLAQQRHASEQAQNKRDKQATSADQQVTDVHMNFQRKESPPSRPEFEVAMGLFHTN